MNQHTPSTPEPGIIDVLIVGAGPTGLTAALGLAKHHLTFRVIEKTAERSPYSKAMAMTSRTLELLELYSARLVDAFLRTGYTSPGANFSTGRDFVVSDSSRLDTNYPYTLFVPQNETETLLEAELTTLGHRIERGIELKTLTQDTNGVTAQLQESSGQMQEVRARYVLGCDGAHSTVRHALGLPFPGKGYPWTAFLADAKIESDVGKNGLTQFSNARGLAILIPRQDDYTRLVTIDTAYQQSSPHANLSLEEMQESVSAILPVPIRLREPRWLTRWSAQLRQVPRYRVGRVFIAGDAAHIHSPAGGQGLNTGVQDGYNVGWKLALVIRGQAPESLLDTYQQERHLAGERALRESDLLLRSTLIPNTFVRTGRDLAFKVLMPLPIVQRIMGESLSGIGLRYRRPDDQSSYKKFFSRQKGLQAGSRVPDVELKPARLPDDARTSVRLYELVRQSPYTLFIAVAPERFEQDRQHVLHLLERLKLLVDEETLKPYIIFDQGTRAIARALPTTTLFDMKRQFHHKLRARHGSLVLIRPDGYVALHIANFDQERLVSGLREWITLRPQQTDTEPGTSLTSNSTNDRNRAEKSQG